MSDLLTIRDLRTYYHTGGRTVRSVDGVSFSIADGETFGLVGESGCGKSTVCRSILRLTPEKITDLSGEILFRGQNILTMSSQELRKIRGKEIGMIFQEPMTTLNPVLKLKTQIYEQFLDSNMKEDEKYARSVEMFKRVGIPFPEKRLEEYIHEFSGGMRQRAMIATILAAQPKLLLADEPTTALDVTIQAQILYLINTMKKSLGMSMILVTHDMGVASPMCDRIAVMYAGRIVELAKSSVLFTTPAHPYTAGLLSCLPQNKKKDDRLEVIEGAPPNLAEELTGCTFAPRCKYAQEVCFREEPGLEELESGHFCRCHFHYAAAQAEREGGGQ